MTPDLPLTDEQAEAISELGDGYESDNELANRWAKEHSIEYGFPESEAYDGKYYFYAEHGLEESAIPVFQEILQGLPEDEYPCLVWEGSYSCSKMRPGEFGGWAVIIYRDRVESFSTSDWIHEKLEARKQAAS
jgi:hypothetical protein